ncbi:MAG: molybdopterin molybdotransferase MoeA [Bacteroidales bacterium]|nr:molybdopterin molybdotransferase MoeA [Bacteroidales bacterium]
MIKQEEAFKILKQSVFKLGTELIPYQNSLGRILAENVYSDMDMPPFNKSAVDGYACRKQDLGNDLELLEIIPAGIAPTKSIGSNQCSQIMTGAEVPEGADTIIMVEHTETINKKIRFVHSKTNSNICAIGEDIRKADLVLEDGTLIKAQQIPVLASVGKVFIHVYRQPKVAVISTGDELVEPHIIPQTSQIRNSNAAQLMAQLKQLGLEGRYIGIAKDSPESTRKMLEEALDSSDIVLLSGGVSMGEFDFVPAILEEKGIKILFKSLAVQPGRPTVFGKKEGQFFFGLPGNPVSSFVQFELLVKPLIYNLMGYDFKPLSLKMPMGVEYTRKKAKRKSYIPVYFNENSEVIPVDYNGSAHIHSYVKADGMIYINIGETTLKKGLIVDVRQI